MAEDKKQAEESEQPETIIEAEAVTAEDEASSSSDDAGKSAGAQDAGDLAVMPDSYPDEIIIAPLKDRPVFPGMSIPLSFSDPTSIEAVGAAAEKYSGVFGCVKVKELNDSALYDSELNEVGTLLQLFRLVPLTESSVQVFARSIKRFRKVREVQREPYLVWEVEYLDDAKVKPDNELKAYMMAIISEVKDLIGLNPIFQEQLKLIVAKVNFETPGLLMDVIASVLTVSGDRMQEVLETLVLYERAKKLLILIREEIEMARMQQQIQEQISEKMSAQQKEFFLREQLKAIKKELGIEKDEKDADLERFEKRLEGLQLSEEAQKVVDEELDKLRTLDANSPERNVTRAYLEVLTDLPWGSFTADETDLAQARATLDEQHYGLKDVKESILELLASIIKRGSISGSILCLVGPPGVGKTSIGRSIAAALDRKFYRFSLGGMRDEAEIKGHRRTYIGAMPGKLIQSIRRAGSSNPVIMLDEIDKVGASYRGDPAAALLEVLDPEQNTEFLDHYLDVHFDLSNVLFVCTANQLDTIPEPLIDRMEIIRLSGYVLEEKVQIARRHLIPKQLQDQGFAVDEVAFDDDALRAIVDKYAREAGVRNLEKQIRKILRKISLKQAEKADVALRVGPDEIEAFLGAPRFTTEELYNKDQAGVALGLAYTSQGGATLYVEASAIAGNKGGFKQTGQLGDVMRESSEIAYSYVRARLCERENFCSFFENHLIHIHVPAGATPKDGPSAGITMALALYSLATGKVVPVHLAMTGELTLTGKVLPIGGVKEKTIAARRVEISTLIFPKANKKDFEELPEYIREGIEVHYADYFDDVLRIAFGT